MSWKHHFIQFDKPQWNFSLFCSFSLINHNEIWAYSAQMVFFNSMLLHGVCYCLSPCSLLSMAELMLYLASAATDENCLGPEGMEKFCEDIGVEPENVSEQNDTCMTRLHAPYLFVMLWMVRMHAEKEGGEKGGGRQECDCDDLCLVLIVTTVQVGKWSYVCFCFLHQQICFRFVVQGVSTGTQIAWLIKQLGEWIISFMQDHSGASNEFCLFFAENC